MGSAGRSMLAAKLLGELNEAKLGAKVR